MKPNYQRLLEDIAPPPSLYDAAEEAEPWFLPPDEPLLQDQHLDEGRLSALGTIRNLLRRATLTADTVLQIIAGLRELGANTAQGYGECHGPSAPVDQEQSHDQAFSGDCASEMSIHVVATTPRPTIC